MSYKWLFSICPLFECMSSLIIPRKEKQIKTNDETHCLFDIVSDEINSHFARRFNLFHLHLTHPYLNEFCDLWLKYDNKFRETSCSGKIVTGDGIRLRKVK